MGSVNMAAAGMLPGVSAHRPVTARPPQTYDHNADLAACARGDQAALNRLYQQESRFLLGVALRIDQPNIRSLCQRCDRDEHLIGLQLFGHLLWIGRVWL